MTGFNLFHKVVIIGVGVIGGSLGMAIKSRGIANTVTGVDLDADNLNLAVEYQAIDEGFTDIGAAISGADLVVIATPVGITTEIIKLIAAKLPEGCIITDVGSTKAKIVGEAEQLMPRGVSFVGGHPMAGSELAGVRGADPYLFENAVYVLTPTVRTNTTAVLKLRTLLSILGANIVELDPLEHDLMVAAVSHLPHLAATALVNTVGDIDSEHEGLLMLAAGGFRDTTRVASGHPLMWKDICITNKENIITVLDKYMEVLAQTRRMIEKCEDDALQKGFEKARALRNNIPSKMKGYLPQVHEIIVTVPDKPGVIGNLAGIMGENGININDIEIMRVREGEGGTIRIALGNETQQAEAVRVLRNAGITVKKR